jgi:hypothetical protein
MKELWSPEGNFNKNNFFLIPSLTVSLPDDWQDNFARMDNLKCLTLYPHKDELNFLRKFLGSNEQSISAMVRRAVDSYLQNKSWRVSILPQAVLKDRSCGQLSVYLLDEQINKLKYLSSHTNRPLIDLVTEAISKYRS